MNRIAAFSALAIAAAPIAAAPAFAQTGYYTVTPVTAPAEGKLVTRSTVWTCDGAVCTAPKSATRDKLLCELVVREVGALQAFRANGSDFDADTLAKCNARAR
ncbi:CC_3452 family protein [Sphingomonas japonica]|uniref:Uncharacterized protein n=1 Tax=Sphingomonas japonica TaxID=511662 RepID=A0ABX0U3B7_9SPHN|nr:hypothetical protein [Sphingomonas japonica]NIJ23267.1 hypothetical protein [Sphingomonas japonica]